MTILTFIPWSCNYLRDRWRWTRRRKNNVLDMRGLPLLFNPQIIHGNHFHRDCTSLSVFNYCLWLYMCIRLTSPASQATGLCRSCLWRASRASLTSSWRCSGTMVSPIHPEYKYHHHNHLPKDQQQQERTREDSTGGRSWTNQETWSSRIKVNGMNSRPSRPLNSSKVRWAFKRISIFFFLCFLFACVQLPWAEFNAAGKSR